MSVVRPGPIVRPEPVVLGRRIARLWLLPTVVLLGGLLPLAMPAVVLWRLVPESPARTEGLQLAVLGLAWAGALVTTAAVSLRRGLLSFGRSHQDALSVTYEQAMALEEKSRALAALNETLEARVQERTAALAQQQLAERMASIGKIAAGVAHQINNPLAIVTGNLRVASDVVRGLQDRAGMEPLGELPQMLQEAGEAAAQVQRLVRDLTAQRADGEPRRALDVRKVVETALSLTANELSHRARIVRDFEAVPPVMGSEPGLVQALMQLLLNAAQAIPEGDVARNSVRVVLRSGGGEVLIEVRDTGVGVPPELLGQIFDPFFTTKPPGRGAGLGLSISHGIVHAHGGELTVTSTRGQGSAFRVTLPALRDVSMLARGAGGPALAPAEPGPRGRVLVVDDEERVATTLRRMLGREHDVIVDTSPLSALDRLTHEKFDAVFCDVMMPELSGVELYQRAVAEKPSLADRFVFVTAGTFTDQTDEFLRTTKNFKLQKPFALEEARAIARQLVNGSK